MRCRNRHSTRLDGVAPGAEGSFSATSKGVRKWLAAGMLEALEPMPASDAPSAPSAPAADMPTLAELESMARELDRRGESVAQLSRANEQLTERVAALESEAADLRALLASVTAPAAPAAESVTSGVIAVLSADNAAPAAPEPPAAPAPSSRRGR
jgi:hypothetical protein